MEVKDMQKTLEHSEVQGHDTHKVLMSGLYRKSWSVLERCGNVHHPRCHLVTMRLLLFIINTFALFHSFCLVFRHTAWCWSCPVFLHRVEVDCVPGVSEGQAASISRDELCWIHWPRLLILDYCHLCSTTPDILMNYGLIFRSNLRLCWGRQVITALYL
jgi:hypothetical protein